MLSAAGTHALNEAAWAVAIVEPNRDFEASQRLRRDGFRVVFLTYRKLLTGHNRPSWRQATDFIPRPLFPGYLFVELWPDQPWPKQNHAGFAGFVSSCRKPLMLSGELVEKWQERVWDGEFDDRKPDPDAGTTRGKFEPANSTEERRKLLTARFAEILGTQDAA